MLPNFVKRLPGVDSALGMATWMQRWYFDQRHGITTMGELAVAQLKPIGGDTTFACQYQPTHPLTARRLFDRLPIDDLSRYTFIDLGSGKGFMLFVAAEYPFGRVVGVEFSPPLHEIAVSNIANYRSRRRRCADVRSVNIDVRDYEFPLRPLVVYMFNPFRHRVLEHVVENLGRSIEAHPRDVLVLYLDPRDAYALDAVRSLRPVEPPPLPGCSLYRSQPPDLPRQALVD